MYAPGNARQREGRNVKKQIPYHVRRIRGDGKEKARKAMSELLEKILARDNMNAAYKRVCANKGAGGVDDVTVEQLSDYIKENWDSIREQIRQRKYKPQPVRRVEIPKPNGGVRKLGIPTVIDRVIQQGIVQIISPMCEPMFRNGVMVSARTEAVKWQSGSCLCT